VLVTLHNTVTMTLPVWIAGSLLQSVYLVVDLVPVYLLYVVRWFELCCRGARLVFPSFWSCPVVPACCWMLAG
jgi:hypothetical protein